MKQSSANQTVVSLADFRECARNDAIFQIETYWEGLRNGRIMPSRSDIDPRDIAGALENAFVLERVARGIGRFRLAGMHLSEVLGMEVRGMPLTALILPESRDEMGNVLASVFDEPAVVSLTLTSDRGLGRPEMGARMVLLPLRSDLGDVSRILGCFIAEGKIGRAPRRFRIVDQKRRSLVGFGVNADTSPVVGPRKVDLSNRATTPRPAGEERPNLVLITNED